MKPLFIPLNRKYFEEFKNGRKFVEKRVYGNRWNERTCKVGRPVTLSKGYGKAERLHGVVTLFDVTEPLSRDKDWIDIFGRDAGRVARIGIRIEKSNGS